jgi:hydroxymethylglutaryl-CoA lyase
VKLNKENFPHEIKIVEVGPRDGLQNEKKVLELEDKKEFINLLSKTGLKTIEVTSFVSPKAIPQMADSASLYSSLNINDIDLPCLVPNLRGFENAMSCGVKEIALFSATSDEFTKKNINCTVDESFDRMSEVAKEAKLKNIKMRGYVSTAFGCPYAGLMDKESLLKVVQRFLDLGVYEVSIGDTIGVAAPSQVHEYLEYLSQHIDMSKIAMHFHDTRGLALTNILVSMEFGIKVFDSSVGGLGGCPYAKGASGNVATEDVLYLMDGLGIKTNVDLDKVVAASKYILDKLGKKSPSKFFNAYINSGY